jgi:small subunit ribosomal protein S18
MSEEQPTRRYQSEGRDRPPQRSGGPDRRPPQRRGGPRGRFQRRRKVCAFCLEKTKDINYKDLGTLRRALTDRGKIKSRRKTGTCAKHQRRLAVAVKRARHLALLPFTAEHIRRY